MSFLEPNLTQGCRAFLAKYAIKDLPLESVVITREMYEDCEVSKTSNADAEVEVDDYFDAFEAEKHDATAVRRRTRLFYHYSFLLQIM